MEHARKMVLVPQDNMNRMNQQQPLQSLQPQNGGTVLNPHVQQVLSKLIDHRTVQTPGDVTSRLDAEMSTILNSSTAKNADEKWNMYQDVLRRFLYFNGKKEEEKLALKAQQLQPQQQQLNHRETYPYNKEAIVSAVPKKYQKNANNLIRHIQESAAGNRLQWDATGVVKLDGLRIPGSNIVDLVNDALRHRQTIKAPGRDSFARFLQEINTPREFVGNKSFWTLSSPLPPPADYSGAGTPRLTSTPISTRASKSAAKQQLLIKMSDNVSPISAWAKLK